MKNFLEVHQFERARIHRAQIEAALIMVSVAFGGMVLFTIAITL